MGEEGSGVGEKDTCCFTGHRPSKLPWGTREEDPRCVALKGRIAAALEEEYAAGVRHFISGMARGADLYFAEAVLALKERRPDVLLECARPCESQADRWPEEERARYQNKVPIRRIIFFYFIKSCPRGSINLTTDNRFDSIRLCRFIKLDCCIHIAMIGYGDRILS